MALANLSNLLLFFKTWSRTDYVLIGKTLQVTESVRVCDFTCLPCDTMSVCQIVGHDCTTSLTFVFVGSLGIPRLVEWDIIAVFPFIWNDPEQCDVSSFCSCCFTSDQSLSQTEIDARLCLHILLKWPLWKGFLIRQWFPFLTPVRRAFCWL